MWSMGLQKSIASERAKGPKEAKFRDTDFLEKADCSLGQNCQFEDPKSSN